MAWRYAGNLGWTDVNSNNPTEERLRIRTIERTGI